MTDGFGRDTGECLYDPGLAPPPLLPRRDGDPADSRSACEVGWALNPNAHAQRKGFLWRIHASFSLQNVNSTETTAFYTVFSLRGIVLSRNGGS